MAKAVNNKICVGKLYNVGSSRKSIACVLPKHLCRALNIDAGTHITIRLIGNGILLTPLDLSQVQVSRLFMRSKNEREEISESNGKL